MSIASKTGTFILALTAFTLLFCAGRKAHLPANRMSGCPRIMVWAWERPEHIADPEIGVAYLAETIRLTGDHAFSYPRAQTLVVAPNTCLVATVRVESDASSPPVLTDKLAQTLAERIVRAAMRPNVQAVQIDFDARRSERDFYRTMLKKVRSLMPPAMGLSITALASWCDFDCWLSDLPVDEVVPMLFRMGPGSLRVVEDIRSGRRLTAASGTLSLGFAVDEPEPLEAVKQSKSQKFHRIYLYSPFKSHTAKRIQTVNEVKQWL